MFFLFSFKLSRHEPVFTTTNTSFTAYDMNPNLYTPRYWSWSYITGKSFQCKHLDQNIPFSCYWENSWILYFFLCSWLLLFFLVLLGCILNRCVSFWLNEMEFMSFEFRINLYYVMIRTFNFDRIYDFKTYPTKDKWIFFQNRYIEMYVS